MRSFLDQRRCCVLGKNFHLWAGNNQLVLEALEPVITDQSILDLIAGQFSKSPELLLAEHSQARESLNQVLATADSRRSTVLRLMIQPGLLLI